MRDTKMVFQSYALFPHMTVAKNIGFGLKLQKWSKKKGEKSLPSPMKHIRKFGSQPQSVR